MSTTPPTPATDSMWARYLATLPAGAPARGERYAAEAWGDSPELADELGALIASGQKTATCGALWDFEATGDAIPRVGGKTVVLDGRGEPLCIIETTEVILRSFAEVDADFAADEGEGDRSYLYWERVHREFFTRTLAVIGRSFDAQIPLVCERFRLLYPLPN